MLKENLVVAVLKQIGIRKTIINRPRPKFDLARFGSVVHRFALFLRYDIYMCRYGHLMETNCLAILKFACWR